jgi:y4mF family transcriptional regulator
VFIRRPSDLGDLVRATRQARGLNQQDLADRLGVSRWWVNGFEGGKPTARLDLVLRALNELQITLAANTNHETEAAAPPPPPAIDIDAIADRGMATAGDASRPARKSRRR